MPPTPRCHSTANQPRVVWWACMLAYETRGYSYYNFFFFSWLLTFYCCFWSGVHVVSEETWIVQRELDLFSFWDHTAADQHFDCRKLQGLCSTATSTDLNVITILRFGKRSAFFLSDTSLEPSVKKGKERKKMVHIKNFDWQILPIQAGNSGNGLFIVLQLSFIIVYV